MPRWMMIGGGLLFVVLCFGSLAVGGFFLLRNKNGTDVPVANQEVASLQATVSAQEAAIVAQTSSQEQPAQQPEAGSSGDQATAAAPGVKVWFDTNLMQEFRIVPPEELWDEKPVDSGLLALDFKNPDGAVLILPVAEYSDLVDLVSDSEVLADLSLAISNGNKADLESCIPIPLTPCDQQVFNLQIETLNFKNGSGIRSASAKIENNAIALNNESMQYSFYGLTTNQQFYITGLFELDHEYLPENDWVFKLGDADIDIDAFDEIFANVYNELSNPNGYTPSLTSIDAVIESLRVEAE